MHWLLVPIVCLSFSLASIVAANTAIQDHRSMAEPNLDSPRIAALFAELEHGNRAALEGFWQEVTQQGTPLFESITGEHRQRLVTFLWRANGETKSVAVIGGPLPSWLPKEPFVNEQAMTRLLDTDLWYKTYRVRTDARLIYLLSPNEPLLAAGNSDPKEGQPTRLPDPLNPHRFTYPQDPEGPKLPTNAVSVVELPDAPPQPFVKPQPDIPAGNVEMYRLESRILGNDRRVWVYTPPDYKPTNKPYGLLLLFDGWDYLKFIPTPTILDNMIHQGLIPPLVAILLHIPDRGRELTCYPPFVDFLAQELLPFVHERYHITSDPHRTIVSGASLGALAATYAGFRRPDVFGNVLSQSGSYWWKPNGDTEAEWLARQFAAGPKRPLRLYLEIGLLEDFPSTADGPSMLTVNRHLKTVLKAKGYPVHYVEFNGRHDFCNWQGGLSDGLLALLGRPSSRQRVPNALAVERPPRDPGEEIAPALAASPSLLDLGSLGNSVAARCPDASGPGCGQCSGPAREEN
jgi:enterochelin esterase-like enzyme